MVTNSGLLQPAGEIHFHAHFVRHSTSDPTRSAGVGYLSVPVVLREAPPHHVGHTEGLHTQQVEDHSVGESELGLEDGRFPLSITKSRTSLFTFPAGLHYWF